ncbi:MAG: methyltransferase [Acidobacteriota bacterium]
MTAPLDPSHVFQVGFGFWGSKVLLTAVEMELFSHLGKGPMTGRELERTLGLHPRATWDFLDALVALGFLERDGDGEDAHYRNTPEGSAFLDKSSQRYVGGMLEMLNARLFRFWDDLPTALRTGEPQNELKHGGKSLFEELYAEPSRLEQFLGAMASLSAPNFELFAKQFDFGKHQTLTDAGGATGLLSCMVARENPHLRCTSFDLPPVEPIAKRCIEDAGLSDRVTTAAGNFFEDPLPKADVVTMGLILHDWNLEKKKHLVRAAHEALPEGGAFVAIENVIDDARRENAFGLLMSLNMLIEFGDAFDFTGADFRGWCREVGFREFDSIPLAGTFSAVIAYK